MDTHHGGIEAELLLRDVGWMRALCRQLVRDSDVAEDVAQDTWLAALKTSWTTSGPSRFWLAHVARNFARARARGDHRRRAREIDAHDVAAQADPVVQSPAELVARVETQRLLSEAVLGLAEPYRATILMRFVEELDPGEIARRCQVPASTVRSRTARGLEQLRAELDRRSQGDRTRWLGAVGPLACGTRTTAHIAAGIGGIVIVKSLVWIGAVVVVALGWFFLSRASTPTRSDPLAQTVTAPTDARPDASLKRTAVIESPTPALDRAPAVSMQSPGPAKMSLRILDASTHEPVPHLAFVLSTPERSEELVSDAQGIVHSAKLDSGSAATIDLSKSADPSDLVQIDRKAGEALKLKIDLPAEEHPSASVHDVEVPTGPTYFLASPLPGGLSADAFLARLVCADSSKAFDRMFAKLHFDESTWMRFSPKARAMQGGPPWKIRIGSVDGLWSGSCEVESNVGIRPAPLSMVFANTGALRGRVTTAKGASVKNEHVIVWAGSSAPNSSARRVMAASAVTDADGRYEALWIAPGACAVYSEHDDAKFEEPLEIQAGLARTFDIQLPPSANSGSLRVSFTSETGTYAGKLMVLAHSLGDSHKLVSGHVAWDSEGNDRRGGAELTGLEPFDQRVELYPDDGTPTRPAQFTARADGRTVDVVVLDRTPMRELAFEVRDAISDDAVKFDSLRISVAGSGPEGPLSMNVDKTTLRTRLPVAPVYAVELHSKGYKPIRAEIEAPPLDKPIVLHARKGWGSEVHAVDEAGHDLANVRIVIDGHDCGLTATNGKLDVELDADPTELKAVLAGWRVSEKGDVDPTNGHFRNWLGWVRVVMEPVKSEKEPR